MHDKTPILPQTFEVVSNTRETDDVVTLRLRPSDETTAHVIAPGQYNMLYVFGVGEVPISASSASTEPELAHTIRDVGAVTHALCAAAPGSLVGVRGPFGHPWPIEAAQGRDLLLIAGGIGLAPLRPAIIDALSDRQRYRRIAILYGARAPEDRLFINDLQQWQTQADQVLISVDSAGPDWAGYVGVVTGLLQRTRFDPENTTALICGPEIMMRFTTRELTDLGVPRERIVVSLERSFSCAMGLCGRCQLGPEFVCQDGPVFGLTEVADLLAIAEL